MGAWNLEPETFITALNPNTKIPRHGVGVGEEGMKIHEISSKSR